MCDLGSSKGKRSGTAEADLLEELESYRRRARELERILAERDLQEAADRKEVSRLAQAFQPARIRAWCWTTEARLTQYLPIRGDVRDSRGRPASQVSLSEETLLQAIHPDDREHLASIWDRAYKEHVPYEIEFQIIDTGIGIELKDIPKALAPFQQIDSELNRKYEGTGLGLPLTKNLVEIHGGSLDLQSEVGVGTTVTVRFPAERIVQLSDNPHSLDAGVREAS